MGENATGSRPPYIPGTPEELDAVIAAPDNHEIVFENDRVRVLRVTIQPGELEKEHTHKWESVFTITSFPKLTNYNEKGEPCAISEDRREGVPFWLGREGLHAVENHGDKPLEAIRVEIKD